MAGKVAPAEFWSLLRSGMQVKGASAGVGVSMCTGYRWLHEAGGPAAVGLSHLGRTRPWGGRHPESVRDRFWDALSRGESVKDAASAAGVLACTGRAWLREAGGVSPRAIAAAAVTIDTHPDDADGVRAGPLDFVDRCRIEAMLRAGHTAAEVARVLGRARSTICREVAKGRTGAAGVYRAILAQTTVDKNRARGGRPAKLVQGTPLFDEVVGRLKHKHSPEQIAQRLRREFPDQQEMWVSHETIYQALYVQPRSALAVEVRDALRTGRTRRKPRGRDPKQPPLRDMVMIADRPAEAEDRAVPGHWEGDLITGSYNQSAIGTLVERSTGFTLLLHLPGDHTAATVAAAMQQAITRLPEHLWRSLTWDQGKEMALHTQITAMTGLPVYFCDPHSPWQRGTNENTNGLLRQYFPKGTDLSFYGPGMLDQVAAELNARPRKRLDWATPAEALEQLLSSPHSVASTA